MLTHALARRAVSSADFDVWVEKLSSEFFFFFFENSACGKPLLRWKQISVYKWN